MYFLLLALIVGSVHSQNLKYRNSAFSLNSCSSAENIVDTQQGCVQGVINEGSRGFYGIPFAEPPVRKFNCGDYIFLIKSFRLDLFVGQILYQNHRGLLIHTLQRRRLLLVLNHACFLQDYVLLKHLKIVCI